MKPEHIAGAAIGAVIGAAVVFVLYKAARPLILHTAEEQVRANLRSLPPEAGPIVAAVQVPLVVNAIAVAVREALDRDLP